MRIHDTFDAEFIYKAVPVLLKALDTTVYIALMSVIFGVLAGLVIAFGKLNRYRLIRCICNIVTNILRGIPIVVLMYIVYFGLPVLILQTTGYMINDWDKKTFVIIALTIELSVTCSEMFRSAYNAIDIGQLEAAHAMGMTKLQRFIRIILPQSIYVILPNLGNAAISVVQGTVLAYTLGIMDVMGKARMLDTNAMHMKTFELYFAVAVIYWIISILLGSLFRIFEKLMGKGQRTVGTSGI